MKTIFNKTKIGLLIFIAFGLFTTACRKEGPGGKSSVSGTVKHHDIPISLSVVYIKYDAKEFPGADPGLYDASVTADANGNYEFKNLRKGDYFLYGSGYDNSISQNVTGGISVKLKYNKETHTDVPVTE